MQFLEERCEQTEDGSITASALYSAYKMWAKNNGFHVMSSNKFGRELSKHGEWYCGKIRSNGVRYQGLLLKQIVTLDWGIWGGTIGTIGTIGMNGDYE